MSTKKNNHSLSHQDGVAAFEFGPELARLEYIIANNIAGFITLHCTLDAYIVPGFANDLKKESERIKHTWSNTVLILENESDRHRYIRSHQLELIRLTGMLLQHAAPQNLYTITDTPGADTLHHYVFKTLTELLAFMEKQFPLYFDMNAWIPENYRRIAAYDIGRGLENLVAALCMEEPGGEITNIILSTFRGLEDESREDVLYHQITYLKELKKQLIQFSQHDRSTDMSSRLPILLYSLNFNAPACYQHCIRLLERDLQNEETVSGRMRKLAYHQKLIHQTQIRPGFALETGLPSLSEQVGAWITAEIKYLESNTFMAAEEDHFSPERNFKIELDLSVARFAYLLRLLTEAKIIRNENISALTRFSSKIFRSAEKEQLSDESIRKKYYNVEKSTRDAIREVLKNLIDHIDLHEDVHEAGS